MPHPIPSEIDWDDGDTSMDRSDDTPHCCNSLKFVHNGYNLTFTREPGLYNEKPHYRANNRAALIVYHCGRWLYQPASVR